MTIEKKGAKEYKKNNESKHSLTGMNAFLEAAKIACFPCSKDAEHHYQCHQTPPLLSGDEANSSLLRVTRNSREYMCCSCLTTACSVAASSCTE